MNANDVILNLVNRLLLEKEKNFMLQLQQKQQQSKQIQDEKSNKD